jgi:hypothetical protein
VRCNPAAPEKKECAEYEKNHEQVGPGEVLEESGTSPALPASTIATLRKQAEAEGTFYGGKNCPKGLPNGKLVYVEGPCNIESGGGNEVGNSLATPGFLIIANGTFTLNGGATFYGVVYDLNLQNSNKAVVTIAGSAELNGAIVIDGPGGASLSSSGINVFYNPKAIEELKTYAGVSPTRNSFRILSNAE